MTRLTIRQLSREFAANPERIPKGTFRDWMLYSGCSEDGVYLARRMARVAQKFKKSPKRGAASEGEFALTVSPKCRNTIRGNVPSRAIWGAGLQDCLKLKFRASKGQIVLTGIE